MAIFMVLQKPLAHYTQVMSSYLEKMVPFSFPSEWNIGLLVLEGDLVINEDGEGARFTLLY